MIRFNNVSTYTKTLLLVILSSIAFILLFLSLYYYSVQQEEEVRKASVEQFDKEIHSLLLLNSESRISTITDITYWDELVKFTKTKNKKWFEESIATSIRMYNVDYLAVYDLQSNFIMKASTDKIKSIDFIPKEVIKQLHKSKLVRFYMKSPEGIVEVFGATIHPSNDPLKNKTKPSGYFFMVSILDADYFKKLEKISSSKINFANNKSINRLETEFISVNLDLENYKKEVVSTLNFKRNFSVNFKSTRSIFIIIIIAFIINVVVNLWYSRKWVFNPLNLITRILETGNRKAIKNLKNVPGEFGYLGNLFEENINQRNLLKKAKEKAEESDNLKSAFLTNLSHEIRTPMNAIIGFTDLLSNSKLSDEERLEYLKIIIQSGDNLVSIIDDLIEMSKIDANQITPNYTSINLESCVDELYNAIKITIPKEKTIDFNLIVPKKTLNNKILTDAIKLKQVIINLITNAIKFTDNGYVTFSYQINNIDSTIVFVINDTGLGIDKAHQEIIFDRFRRIEGDYAIKVGGLGLGLAISKAYVEMLGGTISIQSEIGVGSRFVFTIPLILDKKEKNSSPKIIESKLDDTSGNETILVAEDDNINFLLLEKMMKLKNYKIIRAKNGIEAIEICKNNSTIDLVLMDIKMPKLSGYEALSIIKTFRPELPVIAQTAYSSSEDQEKIMKAGFVNYITKPINKEKLFDIIVQVLNQE
jgi:signal transduction histidine kinase/CheY-like chemotaxis protein